MWSAGGQAGDVALRHGRTAAAFAAGESGWPPGPFLGCVIWPFRRGIAQGFGQLRRCAGESGIGIAGVRRGPLPFESWASFSSEIFFCFFGNVALSFLFDKYCLIMNN